MVVVVAMKTRVHKSVTTDDFCGAVQYYALATKHVKARYMPQTVKDDV